MRFSIPCGQERVLLDLPKDHAGVCRQLDSGHLPALADPLAGVRRTLRNPLGSAPLAELARGKTSACLVISDITRPVPNRLLLPPILETLQQAGIPRQKILLLIATGMHRPNLGPELEELLGAEIAAGWPVVNHDCRERSALVKVAEISGHPLEINRLYLEAELKIVTGLIEPHPFAGFSGGAKSILPGLASLETMRFMHSFQMVDHPRVRTASLAGNPFQEYLDLAAEKAGLDFMLNVVQNRKREVAGLFGGAFPAAFQAGCGLAAQGSVLRVERKFGLVVTSGGGHPLDATLYQAGKGLDPAARLVRPGGEVLWIARCGDGVGGPEFTRMAALPGGAREFAEIYGNPANFTVDQWGAQLFLQNRERAGRVHLYAPGLERSRIASLDLEPVDDLEQTWRELCGRHREIAVLPEGPYLSVA